MIRQWTSYCCHKAISVSCTITNMNLKKFKQETTELPVAEQQNTHWTTQHNYC